MQLRQGRSLWLPTLPYQRTNRYAVVGVTQVFYLFCLCIGYTNGYEVVSAIPAFIFLRPRIGHTNRYMVVSVIPVFVILHPHIGYTNRYAVDGVMSAFVLLRLRISHINRYAIVGAMPVFVLLYPHIGYTNSYPVDGAKLVFHLLCLRIGHTNGYAVVGTTPLICAWTVMGCLLSRTLYIIRCIAVSNEMGFIDRIYQTPKLTNSQRISLPSPLGEGLGVRLFLLYSGIITTSTLFPCDINWCATNCCRRWGVMFCSSAR